MHYLLASEGIVVTQTVSLGGQQKWRVRQKMAPDRGGGSKLQLQCVSIGSLLMNSARQLSNKPSLAAVYDDGPNNTAL